MGYWALWRGVLLQHTKGLCGYPVNRWSTKRPPNETKLDRWSTGGIPRPLGKTRSFPRMFNTRSRKETRGVHRCLVQICLVSQCWKRMTKQKECRKNLLGMDRDLLSGLGISMVDRPSNFVPFGGRLMLQRLTG